MFAWVLLTLFILAAQPGDHTRLVLGLMISALIVSVFFLLGFLSLDAFAPATLVGTAAYGLGDTAIMAVLAVFFISGSLLTMVNDRRTSRSLPLSRRNGPQVWANAWWMCFFLVLSFLTDGPWGEIAAASIIAVATADTWATELGQLTSRNRTVSILNFTTVSQGTDGGVSLYGTFGSLLGAVLIAAVYMLFSYDNDILFFCIIIVSGFLGSIADSILGASIQQHDGNKPDNRMRIRIGNNAVNWLSTGVGGIISIVIYVIII